MTNPPLPLAKSSPAGAISVDGAGTRRLDDPVRGIFIILVAMIFFSISDTCAKILGEQISAIEVVWLRYGGFTLLTLPALLYQRTGLRSAAPLLQIGRGLGLMGSALFFTTGLKFLAMADATAMSFVSPLFITLLSIPLLGERVGLRRWSAIFVGLAGVLIVVRPGTAAFNAASIFPLLSSMSWACGVVLTRKMSHTADSMTTTLAYAAISGFVVVSLLLPFVWTVPSAEMLLFGALMACASTAAQWLLVLGYRRADASVLAPFSYTQLIWSSLAGYLVFTRIPDFLTIVGAGVIVASGLYTAHRERIVAGRRLAAVARSATSSQDGGERRLR